MATKTTCDRCGEAIVAGNVAGKGLAIGVFRYVAPAAGYITYGAGHEPPSYSPAGSSRAIDLCGECLSHVNEVVLPVVMAKLTEREKR